MTGKYYKVLCTRKLDDHWKDQALQQQIILESCDFLEMHLKDPKTFKRSVERNKDPFVFTSVQALKALAAFNTKYPDTLKVKDCFCIVGNTKAEAERQGFNVLDSARDARSLAVCIIESGNKRVLHCSSENRRKELQETLEAGGVKADFCAVYEKGLAPQKAGRLDGIVFYSPSQIDSFLKENKLDETTPAFCIGDTTAGHLKALGHQHIHTSNQSNTESILQTLFEHFKQA